MDNRPIGVFDSGVGGMTVLKEIMKKLPTESFIYLGDTKRFPYGSKTKESIIELTKNGIEFLINKGVKLIVIACGTATSQALDTVKDLYNIPIIGVISPTVEYINKTNKKNIGVIATAGTIRSKGWEKAILEKISDAKVQSIACPLLAPMVEEGWNENKIATLAVKEYLKPFNKIQALILGCTHYPLLIKVIKKQIGKKVEIINIGNFVAIKTEQILNELRINSINNKNQLEVYLTETECKFNEVASKLIGKDIQAKQVKEKIVIK